MACTTTASGAGSGSGGAGGGGAGGSLMLTASELDADGVASIAHIPISRTLSRLAIATKRLNYFEQERSASSEISDDLPIAAALFNEVCFTIVTAAGTGIKVWDAILGNIKAVYPNVAKVRQWTGSGPALGSRRRLLDGLTRSVALVCAVRMMVVVVQSDISAMCLDDRHRKIIVGDVYGEVSVVTHHSGTWMKSFERPGTDAAVVSIVYSGPGKQVSERRLRERALRRSLRAGRPRPVSPSPHGL